jgi:serine/threonine-protein kinase
LKPANIMLDGRGRAHITDFGLAVTFAQKAVGEIAGTPAYMAPEQVSGGPVTPQAVLFSLGLILYELFTGARLFKVASVEERRQREPAADLLVRSGIGRQVEPSVEALILECLQESPVKRPASARSVATRLPGGGDPLEAALAAGETPSPGMVAAAGATRGLRREVAWACFALTAVGLFFVALQIKDMMLYRQAPLVKPPDALVDRAQQILSTFGYNESPSDAAHWFVASRGYDDLARQRSGEYRIIGRAGNAREFGRADVLFVYRQSPQYLVSENVFGVVLYREPPADRPGMADVVLDRVGQLVRFTGVPTAPAALHPPLDVFNWSVAFAEAGINSTEFKRTEPTWASPATYDTLIAWEGARRDRPTERVRITAATWQGRPVLFDVDTPNPASTPVIASSPTSVRTISELTLLVLTLAALAGSTILARRNVRQGRWDRSGALKVGSYVLGLSMTSGLLRAHHVPSLQNEYLLFLKVGGLSLFNAGSLFLIYAAFEPFVRRRLPLVLTSWARVLAGRLRDPLVGRDVLAGALIAVGAILLRESEFIVCRWLQLSPPVPLSSPLDGLGSAREVVALALFVHVNALQVALGWLLILLLLRLVFRSDGLTIVISMLVMAPLTTLPGNHLPLEFCIGSLITALSLYGLMRFGLLTLVVELSFSSTLIFLPISLDPADWYQARSVLALIVLVAIAAHAAYTAQLGGTVLSHDRVAA